MERVLALQNMGDCGDYGEEPLMALSGRSVGCSSGSCNCSAVSNGCSTVTDLMIVW